MPDISMCLNRECALRSVCYRYCAVPSSHQSYMKFQYDKEKDDCDHYVEMGDHDHVISHSVSDAKIDAGIFDTTLEFMERPMGK